MNLNDIAEYKYFELIFMSLIIETVRYITHDSCAISVVPPFNRL